MNSSASSSVAARETTEIEKADNAASIKYERCMMFLLGQGYQLSASGLICSLARAAAMAPVTRIWSFMAAPLTRLPVPDLVVSGEETGKALPGDALQSRNEIARLEAPQREILGQYVNRDAFGDERGYVVSEPRRLRLTPIAEG